MKQYILAVALFGATLLYAETSAFDAGNLQNSSPYGLTPNEKVFKEKLDILDNGYSQVNSQINILSEKIDGLQSIIEGINLQYAKTDVRLSRIEDANLSSNDANLSQEIQNLKIYVEESRRIQEANNQQFKKVLMELSQLVDSINSNYMSKKVDVNQSANIKTTITSNQTVKPVVNISDKNITSQIGILEDSNNTSVSQDVLVENNVTQENLNQSYQAPVVDNSWKQKTPREIMELAIREVEDSKFKEAKEKFELLIVYKHKPSESNFYLGEIEYKQGNYHEAITYYKKSSMISSKNSFTPKLLYHTAISLDKIGDVQNANSFYKALKTNYPKSPEAKASPDRK
ncbi:tetratricopeptide repeat protein [Campylobacter sp. CCS1377]|uniref:Tetratricopeptide repeat protein n=1 Tax=Campylobacter sp. CCS1377 TaxID=3158229 RepID=A0AAU7E672_9BACT|nr:tetratricopeptide repeat protein [Campylobacter jejuni]